MDSNQRVVFRMIHKYFYLENLLLNFMRFYRIKVHFIDHNLLIANTFYVRIQFNNRNVFTLYFKCT